MSALDLALPVSAGLSNRRVSAELDTGTVNTLWVTMMKDPTRPVQNFSMLLLDELRDTVRALKTNDGIWEHMGHSAPVHYAVMRSDHPEYFNLGGDLSYFRRCIIGKDFQSLQDYSKLCLDTMYDWATLSAQNITTIALVQGRALGGGFEAALAADFIIAEEHSTFGFPEIMFGLFPCTGGMSLLSRRVGVYQATRMMTDRRIYSAPELVEMGIIDEICTTGHGTEAVEHFIVGHATRRAARLALQRSRYRLAPLNYEELSLVVDEWVETAQHLTAEELRAMDMLIMMQNGPQKAEPLRTPLTLVA